MLDKDMVFALGNFNNRLKSERGSIFTPELVRKRLADKGQFKKAAGFLAEDMQLLTSGRPITAVDGSRLEYGTFYPYHLAILRTLAGTTEKQDITYSQLLTPLCAEVHLEAEKLACKLKVSNEEGLKLYLKNTLAQMELKTALEAVRNYRPFMLMLDGGFLLFDKFPEWELLCEECLANDIILVGVIEEIATAEVAPLIGITASERTRIYDREILFGLFAKGEYLHFYPEYKIKKNYTTVFARLSTSPQTIAGDFLSEQEKDIEKAINFLFTLTPANGQGIPSWLQIIDARVRLRKKDMDRLLYTCIDRDLIEKYFIPNRERRVY